MELTWTTALSIGHEEIDQQHIALFDNFHKFINGCSKGEARETLIELHDRLKDYADHHFAAERALLEQV